ncbi:3814_t:CDS:1 [Paraglomus brasilianum]|uniref:3814_t:CDS:1 n=1 Tax=Paraglomus brasilianum TaxID=144538 RepID=A0A9N8ZEF0_9GLOM|nr:3814_t:CDS:1 [Paraglomus brasilianum]
MSAIKVTYNATIRKLTLPLTITWTDLSAQLRLLFSIPLNVPIGLSYSDEDGDVITLSSDVELRHVLESSKSSTMSFVLNTGIEDSGYESWVLEGRSKLSSNVQAVMNEDEEDQSQPMLTLRNVASEGIISKETDKKDRRICDSTGNNEENTKSDKDGETVVEQPQFTPSEQPGPETNFAGQIQNLMDQLYEIAQQNPQLRQTANSIVDQIFEFTNNGVENAGGWFRSFADNELPLSSLGNANDRHTRAACSCDINRQHNCGGQACSQRSNSCAEFQKIIAMCFMKKALKIVLFLFLFFAVIKFFFAVLSILFFASWVLILAFSFAKLRRRGFFARRHCPWERRSYYPWNRYNTYPRY